MLPVEQVMYTLISATTTAYSSSSEIVGSMYSTHCLYIYILYIYMYDICMHTEIGGCQNLVTVGRYLYISSFTISSVNQYFGRAQPILMLYVIVILMLTQLVKVPFLTPLPATQVSDTSRSEFLGLTHPNQPT